MLKSSDKNQSGLRVDGLTCERGGRPLFASLCFSVAAGTVLFVVGANGTGKTTLLRALAGLAEAANGDAYWNGERAELRGAAWRATCVYAGHRAGHKDDLSVAENLALACELAAVPTNASQRADALRQVGLERRGALQVKRLSQGQKQRLMLARVCLASRPVWLLDEPSAALDVEARGMLAATLAAHLARGGLAVVATHDRIDVGAAPSAELRLG